jgi:ornithine decarboxylase
MTTSTTGFPAVLEVPGHWPLSLHPTVLEDLDLPTPTLVTDLGVVAGKLAAFTAALPGVRPFYAVKCNPSPPVLRTMAARGAGFEIASLGELRVLEAQGVDPADVLYSNTVKPAAHVAGAFEAGLWRFAVDSPGELRKIARNAPGAAVYVRLAVDDSSAVFPLSRKFGVDAAGARELLVEARRLGLRPYGVTFHVGSQCAAPTSWSRAVHIVGGLMDRLLDDGIRLEMLDLGGGFPARYGDPVPAIEDIGPAIGRAVDALPYRPSLVAAEPGRHLVAEASVMVAGVLGRTRRGGEDWVYLDVGAFHGFMETQQTATGWHYPLWTSRPDHAVAPQTEFTVTGPTCDSGDTMFRGALLPADLDEGDRVYIGSAGAYTLSYASHFNGFPPPGSHFIVG